MSELKYTMDLQFFGGNDVTASEEVVGFLPVIDKLYAKESLTSIFEVESSIWDGKKKIKVPSVDVQGNADYSRDKGYVDGSISVDYEEYELEHDRGRRFNVDAVEANEFPFDLLAESMITFERNYNIPEIDAIRFATIASAAGTTVTADLTSTEEALKAFDDAEVQFLAQGLDMSRAVMYVSAGYYSLIKNYMTERGRLNPNQNSGVINRVVTMLDTTPIIVVPDVRFNTGVELLTGASGQEAGGFKVAADAKKINFLLLEVDAAEAYTKRKADKAISPEDNQNYDGWSVYYRTMHDLIIKKHQKPRIYAHVAGGAGTGE